MTKTQIAKEINILCSETLVTNRLPKAYQTGIKCFKAEVVNFISSNFSVMRCRHDFGRIVGYRAGKKVVWQCRKCGAKKISGGVA